MKAYLVHLGATEWTTDATGGRHCHADAVINATLQWEAREYAVDYFGCADKSSDWRNRNRIEYLCSDFDGNHTYRIHWDGAAVNGGVR